MNAPLSVHSLHNQPGFSIGEVLIVAAMLAVVVGFVLINLFKDGRSSFRHNTAIELANQLQRARDDSMRRNADEPYQMSQVKIFNRRFYSVAVDADGDKNLDLPLVMNLPEEEGVEIEGPFPKTYVFDAHGQTVDEHNRRTMPLPISVTNASGATRIEFSDTGSFSVVPATRK